MCFWIYFFLFHQVITAAVNSVSQSYMVNREQGSIHNVYLSNWMSCSFDGCESFECVAEKLVPTIEGIGDYMEYIMQVPQMPLFVRRHKTEPMEYCIVSFVMSLEAFMKYNNENFLVDEVFVGRVSVPNNVTPNGT